MKDLMHNIAISLAVLLLLVCAVGRTGMIPKKYEKLILRLCLIGGLFLGVYVICYVFPIK